MLPLSHVVVSFHKGGSRIHGANVNYPYRRTRRILRGSHPWRGSRQASPHTLSNETAY